MNTMSDINPQYVQIFENNLYLKIRIGRDSILEDTFEQFGLIEVQKNLSRILMI